MKDRMTRLVVEEDHPNSLRRSLLRLGFSTNANTRESGIFPLEFRLFDLIPRTVFLLKCSVFLQALHDRFKSGW